MRKLLEKEGRRPGIRFTKKLALYNQVKIVKFN